MTMASAADEMRARLAELGRRRAELKHDDEELAEEIKKALKDAKGIVSKVEAADLIGLHRTTLYRVYDPDA